MMRQSLRRWWLLLFRLQRASLYRDLAEMFRRNDAMMGFLEGEIASSLRTGQRARAAALRVMLDCYQDGDKAGRISHLLERVAPRSDAMLLLGVDRSSDKPAALIALAEAVEQQAAMRSTVVAHALLPLAMLPLCCLLIGILSDVILSIDRSTPEYVREALWVGFNGWAKAVAEFTEGYGAAFMAALVTLVVLAVLSLSRWRGRGRLAVDGWPLYGLYRDFQSGLLFTSLAMLLRTGGTLRGSLEDIAQTSTTWMRWHLGRVLRALDDSPNQAMDAFGRGILSPFMLARAHTLHRTADAFADVLIELGTTEGANVMKGVKRAALLANIAVGGLLIAVSTLMGLASLTVPGSFSSLMEPSSLMGLKQAYDARQQSNRP